MRNGKEIGENNSQVPQIPVNPNSPDSLFSHHLRHPTAVRAAIASPSTCARSPLAVSLGHKLVVMENIVESLNNAYQEFVVASAGVIEAKDVAGAQKTGATDTALDNFKQKWELFRMACDQAEEFVESVKQRIGSECLVDEATGSVTGKSSTGLPPISAVRLEQMSKAVRWLVIELQHGSGAAGHAHSSAPFDARFSEDAPQ